MFYKETGEDEGEDDQVRRSFCLNEGWTKEKIRDCYSEGYSTLEVAEMSGVAPSTAYKWCKDIIRPRFLNIDGTIHTGMRNRYEVRGDITVIFLDNNKKKFLQTIIDTADLETLIKHRVTWRAHRGHKSQNYYVRSTVRIGDKCTSVTLHRFLTKAEKDMVVDHFDGDTLNNRRSNLKVVTQSENLQNKKTPKNNTSGERNVIWVKKIKKWRVRLSKNKKVVVSKDFDNYDDAVNHARESRKKYHHFNPDKKVG